jgi:cytoskeletal protein RodZ
MKMQDKEFDDVFRSQLENFEAEPSERVWTGIDDELDSSRRRKLWIPILRVAAVLVVVATAGIIVIQQRQTVIPKPGKKPALAVNQPKAIVKPVSVAPEKEAEPVAQPEPIKKEVLQPANSIAKVVAAKRGTAPAAIEKAAVVADKSEEQIVRPQLVAMADATPATEIKHAVVPNNDVPLAIKDPEPIINSTITKPVLAQAPSPDQPARPVKHKGIHSFGDLVNLVANKVEKQKAASALDEDDDDSAVAKINRGIQRVRQERETK